MTSLRTQSHIERRKKNASRKAYIKNQLDQLKEHHGIRLGMASHNGWHRLDFGLFGDSDFHAMRQTYQFNSLDQVVAFIDGIQSTIDNFERSKDA